MWWPCKVLRTHMWRKRQFKYLNSQVRRFTTQTMPIEIAYAHKYVPTTALLPFDRTAIVRCTFELACLAYQPFGGVNNEVRIVMKYYSYIPHFQTQDSSWLMCMAKNLRAQSISYGIEIQPLQHVVLQWRPYFRPYGLV